MAFTDKIKNSIRRYIEYLTLIERMNQNLALRSTLEEVDQDLKSCRYKGFVSKEINGIKRKLSQLKELYAKSDNYLKSKKTFNVKHLLYDYKTITNNMADENNLLQ